MNLMKAHHLAGEPPARARAMTIDRRKQNSIPESTVDYTDSNSLDMIKAPLEGYGL